MTSAASSAPRHGTGKAPDMTVCIPCFAPARPLRRFRGAVAAGRTRCLLRRRIVKDGICNWDRKNASNCKSRCQRRVILFARSVVPRARFIFVAVRAQTVVERLQTDAERFGGAPLVAAAV